MPNRKNDEYLQRGLEEPSAATENQSEGKAGSCTL